MTAIVWKMEKLQYLVMTCVDRQRSRLMQPGRDRHVIIYHGLRGSASPVLTATGFVNGRWQFSTPHRIHTP